MPEARTVVNGFGKLPLSFEANQGQTDAQVKFLARGRGYTLFLLPAEAVLALTSPAVSDAKKSQTVLRMKLLAASPSAEMNGSKALLGKAHYFLGNNPKQWRTNVPTYQEVRQKNIYPGIDLIYYGKERQLEYDFVVAPEADPSTIVLAFEGTDGLDIDAQGNLLLSIPAGTVRLQKPVIYQETKGVKKSIDGGYILKSDKNQVAFQIASYDRELPLIIDPVLSYSTYLGGSNWDQAAHVKVDNAGNAYVVGRTRSSNFPTTGGVFQASLAGDMDVFVAKLNPTGTGLIYSTYIGGSSFDAVIGMTLDTTGNVYLTGTTNSANFPTTAGAFQAGYAGGPHDGFVTKLGPSGSTLVYSTYLGGTQEDQAYAIAVDGAGNAYVTGNAQANFPATAGAFSTAFLSGDAEIYVTKLNPTGTGLLYSTAIPGAHPATDSGQAIVVDATGNAYVSGTTRTAIGTPGAFQTTYGGGINGDAFVLKLNPAGSALLYATNLGGSGPDGASSLAIDAVGNAYVCGGTESANFPTTTGALQTTFAGGVGVPADAIVTKLNPTGSALVYSTYSWRQWNGRGLSPRSRSTDGRCPFSFWNKVHQSARDT